VSHRTHQLIEALLDEVCQVRVGLAESVDYRIFGGKHFRDLAAMELASDGLKLLVQVPVTELTPKELRELARRGVENPTPWETFTPNQKAANLPANARPFNRNNTYLVFDGTNAVHVTFNGNRRVSYATKYGWNDPSNALERLGTSHVSEYDEFFYG
jgi:hypothetical protein